MTLDDIRQKLLGTWWTFARERPSIPVEPIPITQRERLTFHDDGRALDRRYGEQELDWEICATPNNDEFRGQPILLLTYSLTPEEIRATEEFTRRKLSETTDTRACLVRKINEDELELQHYGPDEKIVHVFRRTERAKS